MKKLRWGVIGAGGIADRRTIPGMMLAKNAELIAVMDINAEQVEKIRQKYGAKRGYTKEEDLLADPEVDAVYIATPHRFHLENALLCIRSGRAILCEKAFTVNGDEAEKIAQEAKARGVFAMEAFWPRFQPLNRLLKKLICEQKIIGDVRMLQVDVDKLEDWPDEHRIYNPALAGGTTLDLGIYTMSYAAYFLGAFCHIAPFDFGNLECAAALTTHFLLSRGAAPVLFFAEDRAALAQAAVAYRRDESLNPLLAALRTQVQKTAKALDLL